MLRFVCLILIGCSLSLFAEFDDWGTIDEPEYISSNARKKTITNYWDQHFYGAISGMVSSGQNHSRHASEIKLGFSDHWQSLKFVIEGAYRQNTVDTKYNQITYYDNSSTETSVEGEEVLRYDSTQLRQAYVDYYPVQNLTLSFGQQTIVWGQLDIFSPVDFLLPIDFSPVGFSLTKADNRMPQTVAKMAIYPNENLEISTYYFPYFEESEVFKVFDLTSNYREIDGVKYYTTKVIPSGQDQASYAARLTWYNDVTTFALTYYKGFNNVFPVFRSKFLQGDSFTDEYGYYPKQGVGAEISVPFGKKTFKMEAAISDSFYSDLSFSSSSKR